MYLLQLRLSLLPLQAVLSAPLLFTCFATATFSAAETDGEREEVNECLCRRGRGGMSLRQRANRGGAEAQ